jgi:hypothetical protein
MEWSGILSRTGNRFALVARAPALSVEQLRAVVSFLEAPVPSPGSFP